jgi:hypothetical protein
VDHIGETARITASGQVICPLDLQASHHLQERLPPGRQVSEFGPPMVRVISELDNTGGGERVDGRLNALSLEAHVSCNLRHGKRALGDCPEDLPPRTG